MLVALFFVLGMVIQETSIFDVLFAFKLLICVFSTFFSS